MPSSFVRAQGGLGNKLRVVLSYREAHVVDGGTHLVVVWVLGEECPARFLDLFEPLDGVSFIDTDDPAMASKLRAFGAPDVSLPRDMHSHPAIASVPSREAAMFLHLRPRPALVREIGRVVERCGAGYCAVHVRRTDHAKVLPRAAPALLAFAHSPSPC